MSAARLALSAGDARAEVSQHGAQVLSWRPAGPLRELLYLSPLATFAPGHPVRGGIPVLFPQFGLFGPLPKHGLVRAADWQPLPTRGPHEARLGLRDSASTRADWPFAFALELTVLLGLRSLTVRLQVHNTDARAFTFTAGLHTYLRVENAAAARLEGLAGHAYLDALDGLTPRGASGAEPPVASAVDRVYLAVASPVRLFDGALCVEIDQTGFEDVVVWNPGGESTLPDLPPGAHTGMLCVEAAQIANPVTLAPGACWEGTQTLRAVG